MTAKPTLDQYVKGAPASGTSLPEVAASALANLPPTHPNANVNDRLASIKTPRSLQSPADPTSLLPSSPPQIYLNLLILEASLRSQYLTLRARRRQNSFVLTLLAGWQFYFTYLLWLRPREDGKGIGGSQYWLIDMTQKLCFITGLVTLLLFWATGQWERGVRWPRRWIGVANRGLRGFNAKMVVLRGSWWSEFASWVAFMRPFSGGLWGGETGGSSYHFINLSLERKAEVDHGGVPRMRVMDDGKEYAEEDIAPGGDYIMLLLLPKPFSPDFREGWETYRHEYWSKENERRAELRKRIHARQREMARAEGGWLWWTGWRGWKRARGFKGAGDLERTPRASQSHSHHHTHSHHRSLSTTGRKRRSSALKDRDGSHSRGSSRSTTPTPDMDEIRLRPHDRDRERRWSTSTAGSTSQRPDVRRTTNKKPSTSSINSYASPAPGTAQSARQPPARMNTGGSSRPGTPVEGSSNPNPWQTKRASGLRDAGTVADPDAEGRNASSPSRQGKRRELVRKGSRESFVFPNAPSA